MPAAKPRPTDATGVARAREIKKNETLVKERAEEISTIAAKEAFENENLVFDPSVLNEVEVVDEILDPSVLQPAEEVAPVVTDEVVVDTEITLEDDSVVVRLLADIPTMVYGVGNEYSFIAGRKYRVSKELAGHLESIGYLYL